MMGCQASKTGAVTGLHIIPNLGTLTLSGLTRAKVVAWHGNIASPIAANRALAYLSSACSYAVDRDMLPFNPCSKVKVNKEKASERYLSDIELHALFNQLKETSLPAYNICIVLALTGMRSGEFLSDYHFDEDRKVIWLRDSKTVVKSVALNKEAHSFIKALKAKPFMDDRCLRHYFKVACLKVGVQGATPHTLRHTLATYMAQHGDSAFMIAGMGGWKSLAMVQRYVNLHGIGTPHKLTAGERIARAIGLEVLT